MAQPEKDNHGSINVLSVVWYKVLPPNYGGQKAVALFNSHLSRYCSLTCLCSVNNEAAHPNYPLLRHLPVSKLQFVNPFTWFTIYQIARREGITHLVLEFPYHGIAGFICKTLLGVKFIVNTHNIEFLRFKEQGKWWWKALYYFEKWVFSQADAVFFKTVADQQLARTNFGVRQEKLLVVPYGATEPRLADAGEARKDIRQRHAIQRNEKILLFAGTLDYLPNAEAVRFIAENILPKLLQDGIPCKVIVCGRNYLSAFQYIRSLEGRDLIFAGDVDDIEDYFIAADVFIDPVSMGGGIQTKLMDALSYQLNVVCFRSKAAHIQHAEKKIFAVQDNDATGFAEAIELALNSDEQTPPAFFESYNWRTIAASAYKKLMSL